MSVQFPSTETELQEGSRMFRALRADVRDRKRSSPSQYKWKSKQDGKKKSKVAEAGDAASLGTHSQHVPTTVGSGFGFFSKQVL
jgi:hypothetical protein